MTSALICAAVCLLLHNGCQQAARETPPPPPTMVDGGASAPKVPAPVQTAVEQQSVMVKRAYKKSKGLDKKVEALAVDVKKQRFAYLSHWARLHHLTTDHPPAEAAVREDIKKWWQEWRDLKIQFEGEAVR